MTPWKLALGDAISGVFGRLPRRRVPGCRVLMYHALGTVVSGDSGSLYTMSPTRFRTHLDALAQDSAHAIVALAEGVAAGAGSAITFDDGYADALTVAAPLLLDRGVPFTVFVAAAFVREARPDFLSRAGLRELATLPGVTIGAHGDTHCRLTDCDDASLAKELAGSRAWLEDAIGRPVETMSYPHGAVDARVKAATAAAGYRLAACSRFGSAGPSADRLLIPRLDIWAQDDVGRLRAKLSGAWDWMSWRD